MKDFLIDIINWLFNEHCICQSGWLWIVTPIAFLFIIWLIIGLIFHFIMNNFGPFK